MNTTTKAQDLAPRKGCGANYFCDNNTDSRKRTQFERVYILIPPLLWTKRNRDFTLIKFFDNLIYRAFYNNVYIPASHRVWAKCVNGAK